MERFSKSAQKNGWKRMAKPKTPKVGAVVFLNGDTDKTFPLTVNRILGNELEVVYINADLELAGGKIEKTSVYWEAK